jgi:extracellular elastinolytic metalloproteinase
MKLGSKRSARVLRPRYLVSFALTTVALALSLPASALGVANILDDQQGLPDYDARTRTVQPTAGQLSLVEGMHAHATWNRFGTPESLIKYGGYLATGLSGSPADAARSWIRANHALFRLTAADVGNLDLVNDSPIVETGGHAVLFRQRFGDFVPTQDGLITVGVNHGRVFYASSSSAGSQAAPPGATLTATMAFLAAAANVGRPVSVADVTRIRKDQSWTVLSVKGFATPFKTGLKSDGRIDQRVRLVAFPTYTNGVRPAYETIVLDVQGGSALAYKVFVDARTGDILMRQNEVDQIDNVESGRDSVQAPKRVGMNHTGTFHGSNPLDVPPAERCGPDHAIPVDENNRTIGVAASAENTVNDIILYLKDQNKNVVESSDEGTSEEAVTHSLPGGADQVGDWYAQVCESPNPGALPGRRSAAGRAGPDASRVRRDGRDGDARHAHGARQPVHGRARRPGRAGQRPDQQHRLLRQLGRGADGSHGGAGGLLLRPRRTRRRIRP